MTRETLHGRGSLHNGAPRHHHTVCADACGWRGVRTADNASDIGRGRPCPRCGNPVRPGGTS